MNEPLVQDNSSISSKPNLSEADNSLSAEPERTNSDSSITALSLSENSVSASTEHNDNSSSPNNTEHGSVIAQKMQDCQQQVKDINKTEAADRTQGNYGNLSKCYKQNLDVAREEKTFEWEAYALNNLAISHFVVGDYLKADF